MDRKENILVQLAENEAPSVGCCLFMAPLGNNFVQKPDYRDNKDKGGSFTFLLLVLP